MKYQISGELLQAIVNYLITKPFAEVNGFITSIQKETNQEVKEEVKVEEAVEEVKTEETV